MSLEAIYSTEMKSSRKKGEADEGTGGEDARVRGWEKVIQVVRWQRLRRKQEEEEGTGQGEAAGTSRSRDVLERKGKLLAGVGGGSDLLPGEKRRGSGGEGGG